MKSIGNKLKTKGINLNEFTVIDSWSEIRKSGFEFALLEFSHYDLSNNFIINKRLQKLYTNLRKFGFLIGGYFYSRANSKDEIEEEIDSIIPIIRGMKFEYPVSIVFRDDIDFTHEGSKEELTDVLIHGLEYLKSYGYTPMLGTHSDYLYNKLDRTRLRRYLIWLWEWTNRINRRSDCEILQYAYTNSVPGVRYSCGVNVSYNQFPLK